MTMFGNLFGEAIEDACFYHAQEMNGRGFSSELIFRMARNASDIMSVIWKAAEPANRIAEGLLRTVNGMSENQQT